MQQPTTTPSAPAPAAPAPAQSAAPTANITRTDGVVGGAAPAATGGGGTQSTTLQPSSGDPNAAAKQPPSLLQSMTPMILIVGVFFIFMIMMQRKEGKKRAEHAATLAGLQRNDKVETIGGVLGTVAELTDTEVVIKTDDITNTRIRVRRNAISSVLNRTSKPDGVKIEPVKTGA